MAPAQDLSKASLERNGYFDAEPMGALLRNGKGLMPKYSKPAPVRSSHEQRCRAAIREHCVHLCCEAETLSSTIL